MRASRTLAPVLTLGLLTASAPAAIIELQASLDGLQVVLPVATPGSGEATLLLNDVTGGWTISGSFSNLIGTTTVGHVHGPGTPDVNTVALRQLIIDFGVTSGSISGGSAMGLDGGDGAFTPAEIAHFLNEMTYMKINTTFRPGGEVRGHFYIIPAPSAAGLLALAGLTASTRRRRA